MNSWPSFAILNKIIIISYNKNVIDIYENDDDDLISMIDKEWSTRFATIEAKL